MPTPTAPKNLNPNGLTSYTDEGTDTPQFNIYGPLGAGKTTMAVSVSEFFPDVLPTKRAVKGAKLKDLEDIIIIAYDKDPAIGLSERGFKAEQFLVRRFMGDERLWKRAKFHNPPDFIQANEVALEVVAEAVLKRKKKWIIVDTASHFDADLEGHYRLDGNMPKGRAGGDDTQAMYGLMKHAHRLCYQALSSIPAGLVVCAHVKAYSDQMTGDQKRSRVALTTAGMPDLVPAITGGGALIWKIDAVAEFFLKAQMTNNKYERWAFCADSSAEGKNRLELSIPNKVEPHLGKILKMAGMR